MRAAAERGARLTDQLLSFSRRQRLEPKVIDLSKTVARMARSLAEHDGRLHAHRDPSSPTIYGRARDPTQLELAVLDLSIDARDAMEMGGTLSGGTANVQLGPPVDPEEPPSGGSVAVEVTDAGDGMSKEVRFEPFFTTKEIGKGSGLASFRSWVSPSNPAAAGASVGMSARVRPSQSSYLRADVRRRLRWHRHARAQR